MSAAPRVSVLMPVYNGERDLRSAIDSVLAQTFGDFEFLIVDDGSSDGSLAIVSGYRDPRIRVLPLERSGFAAALDRGLDEARGEFVARMDADDVCLPDRLALQVAFMDAHPQIGISGTDVRTLTPGTPSRRWTFPTDPAVIRAGLLFEPGLAHPTVISRRAWLDRHGLRYDASYPRVEDWDFWRRAAEHFDLGNLPRVLLEYRVHESRMSSRHGDEQRREGRRIQGELLERLGLEDHPLRRIHGDVSLAALACSDRGSEFVEESVEWFETLRRANLERRVYEPDALDAFLADRVLLVLNHNRELWGHALQLLWNREWMRHSARWPALLRLLAKGALSGRIAFLQRS
jgi:glycosyltransferase involved in cell wall biosynthesis